MQEAPSSSLEFRRRVYAQELWVEGNPESSQPDPHCVRRLLPWLQRELEALLVHQRDQMRLMAAILWELSREEFVRGVFTDTVRRHLGPQTSHFLHEFLNFTGSALFMESYDLTARYSFPLDSPLQPSPPVSSDECQVVGYVRPRSERTPSRFVDLTGDEVGAAGIDNSDNVYPVPPTSPLESSPDLTSEDEEVGAAVIDNHPVPLTSPTRSETSPIESSTSPEYPSSLTSTQSLTYPKVHSPTHNSTLPRKFQTSFQYPPPSPPYSPPSSAYSPIYSTSYPLPSPRYCPPSPAYSPIYSTSYPLPSPRYCPPSPAYRPDSPAYRLGSPAYRSGSPAFYPDSPVYRPGSPAYCPDSPAYYPDSPVYRPGSPAYRPGSPAYRSDSPAYRPGSPAYRSDFPAYRPDSPAYFPYPTTFSPPSPLNNHASPQYAPTMPPPTSPSISRSSSRHGFWFISSEDCGTSDSSGGRKKVKKIKLNRARVAT